MTLPHKASGIDLSPSEPGVYFLVQGDEVVYVGQSLNVMQRVATHVTNRRNGDPIAFDSASWVSVPRSDLDDVESAFFWLLSPRHNGFPAPGLKRMSRVEARRIARRFGWQRDLEYWL